MSRSLKEVAFDQLKKKAEECRRCPMTMLERTFLGHNGPLDAELLFIGEAPGVEILDGPTRPMSGSKSGRNFDMLLEFAGVNRDQVFVTNALLHTPIVGDKKGGKPQGRGPSEDELFNCTDYLLHQIRIVNPKVVVTLGAVALRALGMIEAHGLRVTRNVAQLHPWKDWSLVPLFHTSPNVITSRLVFEQHSMYYRQLGDYLEIIKDTPNPRLREFVW